MKTYVKFGLLMTLIVGSLVWLAVGGISDTKAYYKTIPELQKMGSWAQTHRLRVSGDVKPGSIVKTGTQVNFVLRESGQTLNVVYTGMDPLPDTFRDNAQALADGRLRPDGVFQANQIQAKCASKYAPKVPQRNITHAEPGQKISTLRLPSNQ
jgi:cytochrome c-type biogenesis protein CcmE